MPTNEERREVAARLRRLASHKAADEELTLEALGLCRGENIEGYDTYGVMRLADLIEPERTCQGKHIEGCEVMEKLKPCPFCGSKAKELHSFVGVDMIACEACGAKVSFDSNASFAAFQRGQLKEFTRQAWNTRAIDERLVDDGR